MTDERPALTIRSFRLAFELERRIHKIDRFRLPLPYGLPLRSLAYALAALASVVALSRLPLMGMLLAALPWPIRFGVLPVAIAQLLTQLQLDGRPAHEVLASWLRLQLGPRNLVAFSRADDPRLDPLLVAPDERGTSYRRGKVVGAGGVLLRQHAEVAARGTSLIVEPADEHPGFRAKQVVLKSGQQVVIR